MNAPRPTATGSLESTPLVNLLIYALDHRLTGTLVLEEQPGGHKHALHFLLGAPTKAKTAQPVAYLGQVLVDLGIITEAVNASTWAEARAQQRLHGDILLIRGHINESALRAGLREQLARQAVYLAGRPQDTVYGYYDEVNLIERWGAPEMIRSRPLELIWRVIEAHSDVDQASSMIARLGDRPLRLHLEAPITRFRFGKREQAVLDILRAKPQPFNELVARELTERSHLERLIYTLLVTRQLELGPDVSPLGVDEAPSSTRLAVAYQVPPSDFGAPNIPLRTSSIPAAAPARSSTPAPRGLSPSASARSLSPELSQLRDEIIARAARDNETLYDALGVSKDVTQSEVQAAFVSLAKKWHPDRLPSELSDVRDLANRVFSRMTEASQVLSDPSQRREYETRLRRAGREAEEAEHVQRVLRAATAFQKAEVHLKRNNLAAAEAEAKQALADDPDQADHIALVAWLDAQKPDANLETCIKALDRAIQIQPTSVRAHWYRGQLYKRVDKMSRAIRDFRYVIERDPRHVDAQREVRLYVMRRGERGTSIPPSGGEGSMRPSPAPPAGEKQKTSESGGFISKLFKR